MEKEKEPTSPWLEEVKKRTRNGIDNHFIEICGDVQEKIEKAADDGFNYLCYFNYRESEEKELIKNLSAFGFKVKPEKTLEYAERYLVISW